MSRNGIIIFFVSLILFVNVTHGGEVEDFIEDVNTEWAAKNFTNMYQVIIDRLTTHTNDLPALLLKMNYYLTIDYNLNMAQNEIPIFTNTLASIDWSSDKMAKIYCKAMAAETSDPTNSQNHGVIFGLSSNQIDELHADFPTNHPLADFLIRVGAVQYGQ